MVYGICCVVGCCFVREVERKEGMEGRRRVVCVGV